MQMENFMAIFDASGLSTAPVRTTLDEGWYTVRVRKCEGVVSSKKGTPGVHFEYQVSYGPAQQAGGSAQGRVLFDDLWIPTTPGSGRDIGLSRLRKVTECVGMQANDKLELMEFTNKELQVKVKHEEFNGETKERIADYKSL
jgi:hypothetical protein